MIKKNMYKNKKTNIVGQFGRGISKEMFSIFQVPRNVSFSVCHIHLYPCNFVKPI